MHDVELNVTLLHLQKHKIIVVNMHLYLCDIHAFSCPYFRFDVVMPQIKAMVEDFLTLLGEVHDSDLLKKVENLIQNINQASDDLRLTV